MVLWVCSVTGRVDQVKREIGKVKGKNKGTHTTHTAQGLIQYDGLDRMGFSTAETEHPDEEGDRRSMRRRGVPVESKETIVQNELAALEDKLDRCKVRCDPLGMDRHRNEYYWFPSLPECLCVINYEQTAIRST